MVLSEQPEGWQNLDKFRLYSERSAAQWQDMNLEYLGWEASSLPTELPIECIHLKQNNL